MPEPYVLKRVSATQVEGWDRCKRYWYARWVLKLPAPTTIAMQRGSDIHKGIENFLLSGVVLENYKDYVEEVRKHLPKTEDGVGYLVEREMELATFDGGPKWVGKVDLIEERTIPEPWVRITDYKSTANFKWVKTPEELRVNVQLNSYSKWLFTLDETLGVINLRHIYIRTKGKVASRTVPTLVTRDEADRVWLNSLDSVRGMVSLAAEHPDTLDPIEPTLSACSMYGGCAYRNNCNLSPLKGLFMTTPATPTKPSTLLERLALKQASAPAIVPPAPTPGPTGTPPALPAARATASIAPTGAVAVSPPTAAVPMSLLGQRMAAAAAGMAVPSSSPAALTPPAAAPVALVPPPAPAAPVVPPPALVPPVPPPSVPEGLSHTGIKACYALSPGGQLHCMLGAGHVTAHGAPVNGANDWQFWQEPAPVAVPVGPAVLPPDAGPRTSTPADVAAANAPKKRGRQKATPTPDVPAGVAPPLASLVPAAVTPVNEAEAARQAAFAASAAAAAVLAASPAPVPAALSVPLPSTTVATFPSLAMPPVQPAAPPVAEDPGPSPASVYPPAASCSVEELFVDCYPIQGRHNEAVLAETILSPLLALAAKDCDVLDVGLVDFGKGKAAFKAILNHYLDQLPKVLVVSTRSYGAEVLIDCVTPHVPRVVKALR